MTFLSTPDFVVRDFPFSTHFLNTLPGFGGLKLAYVDEQPTSQWNGRVALCLHGEPTWSYLYRKMIPLLLQAGYRVVAPDLFGFGRSDKPTDRDWYSFSKHRASLLELIDALQLRRITLVVQDWGGLLGLTLPHALPDRFEQLLVMNTTLATGDVRMSAGFNSWRTFMNTQPSLDCAKLMQRSCPHLAEHELAAYALPFQYTSTEDSAASMAGVMRFPSLVPEFADDDGAEISLAARAYWKTDWRGQSFMAIGMQDPVLGPPVMRALQAHIRGCPPPMEIANGGHFLQEWENGSGDSSTSITAAALASWN